MSQPQPEKPADPPFSSFYGCGIIAISGLLFLGMIAWGVYTLLRQDAEIDGFADLAPVTFADKSLSPAAQSELEAKFSKLKNDLTAKQPASLTLSIAELNAAIAQAPDMGHGTYAAIVHFTGTRPTDQVLLADISLPINPLPFSDKPKRYLNAKAEFVLEVSPDGPDVRIIKMEAPGKVIPGGFIESQNIFTWVKPYRNDPEFARILRSLTQAKVTAGGFELSTQKP